MVPVRLVTLAPGHFHAALIQKEMQSAIDRKVHVYSPLDADLAAHISRIAGFNGRAVDPTAWRLDVLSGEDWRERFLAERPGNVVVLAGRNRSKIDLMQLAVDAGMHVLADKPWIIDAADLPKLSATIDKARSRNLLLYDMMTERHEIMSILQREFVNDPEVFGEINAGDAEHPAITMESIHYLKKDVAGVPLRRPPWFFDINEQGEALADVGTHLVDLVLWTLFQDSRIDFATDVRILAGRRWPTILDRQQFQQVTGLTDFPPELEQWIQAAALQYFCNNQVLYSVRGVHVRLDVLWDYEATSGGGDTHNAIYRGSRSSVAVRQQGGKVPELFVSPHMGELAHVEEALKRRVESWQQNWQGVTIADGGGEFRVIIPDRYRIGHEAHFGQVVAGFLSCLREPESLPDWEMPLLLAKYATTTHGIAARD